MTHDEQHAILGIALMAAFADGSKSDLERDEVRRIVDALAAAGEPNLPALYQQVLLKTVTPASAAARLGAPELRRLAYEMAVGVCDADGARREPERRFLAELQQLLALDPVDATDLAERADALAEAPLGRPLPAELEPVSGTGPASGVAPAGPAPLAPAAGPGMLRSASLTERELDDLVTHSAILNGALELLPESVSTMAIIPLQMKLVYRIGKAYGYELDSGHVREFLAAAGIGLSSQYLEHAATRLVGGLLGAVGGRLLGGLGRQATSSAMAFASTWALGQLARRHYASGRTLDAASLRSVFSGLLEDARALQPTLVPQIEARARTLDVKQVLRAIGG
jgi:uncharacterized protein (DUF697 family)/tellurite resistance protein